MEVGVEVQRGTEALDEGDRPGPGATGDGESGPHEEVGGDGSIDHAQDLAQYLRLGGEQEPQGIGEGEHPLANRLCRKDMIGQVSRGLDHPAGATGRAEAAALAGERHQVLVAAGVALDAQKAVLEPAALQVVVELLLDERGQRATVGLELSEKLRVVRLDDPVEVSGHSRPFWTSADY